MNEYINLGYQFLVLVMLGVQIGLLSHLVRRHIHPKPDSLVNQGDTNVSLQTRVHQGDRNVMVPPVNIAAPMPPNLIPTPYSTQIPIGK